MLTICTYLWICFKTPSLLILHWPALCAKCVCVISSCSKSFSIPWHGFTTVYKNKKIKLFEQILQSGIPGVKNLFWKGNKKWGYCKRNTEVYGNTYLRSDTHWLHVTIETKTRNVYLNNIIYYIHNNNNNNNTDDKFEKMDYFSQY